MSETNTTFVEKYLHGRARPSEIEDFVEQWHEGNIDCPLPEFLGLTNEEYAHWVEDPTSLWVALLPKLRGHLRDLAKSFNLLSNPTRLGIIDQLAKGPKNVTALSKALKLKRPTISYHLGRLRMGRLVNGTREGKSVIYTADKKALKELQAAVGKLTP